MAQRYSIRQEAIWSSQAHPARGVAQNRRNSQPMDRKALLRANLQIEFAKVLRRNGIPSKWCDDESGILAEVLARQIRMYLWAAYLIQPEIAEGMTIGKALDVTTDVLWDETQRRRLARLAHTAALGQS